MEAAAQLAKQAIVQRVEEELYNVKGTGGGTRRSWGSSLLTSIATSVLMKVLQRLEVDIKDVDISLHHEHKEPSFSPQSSPKLSVSPAGSPQSTTENAESFGNERHDDAEALRHFVVGFYVKHIHVGSSSSSSSSKAPSAAREATTPTGTAASSPMPPAQTTLAAGVRQLISKHMVIEGVGVYIHNQSLLWPPQHVDEEGWGLLEGAIPLPSKAVASSPCTCQHRRAPENADSPFWMVEPVCVGAAYRASTDHPKHGLVQDLNVDVTQEIRVHVNREHYHSMAALLRGLQAASTQVRYWTLRPKAPVKEDPGGWWRYAKDVVLAEIQRQNGRSFRPSSQGESSGQLTTRGDCRQSWGDLVERAKLRDQYLLCYKRLLAATGSVAESVGTRYTLPPDLAAAMQELTSLELELTAEEILLYRAVGRTKAKLEGLDKFPEGQSVLQNLYRWLPTTSSLAAATWSTALAAMKDPHSVASLTSESTLDDVADALFHRYGRQGDSGGRWGAPADAASTETPSAYLHVNLHVPEVHVALETVHLLELHARKVLDLEVKGIQGEVWMTIPGEEMGLNISVGAMAAVGPQGENVLCIGSRSAEEKVRGKAALLLHLDVCPLQDEEEGLWPEASAVNKFTLDAYLSGSHLQHKQLTLEVVVAPLKVHVDPTLARDLSHLAPVSGSSTQQSPFARVPHFQDLRYLAACRKAYRVPSHVDFVLRQHVAVNLAITVEEVELRLGTRLLHAESEGEEAVATLKGFRVFQGAYLEALLLQAAEQEATAEEAAQTFLLKHSLKPPSARAQRLLQTQSSAYVERTYVSLPSLSLDAVIVQREDGDEGMTARLPLLALPLAGEALATSCVLPGHPGYPRSRVDLLLSPLELRVSERRLGVLATTMHAFQQPTFENERKDGRAGGVPGEVDGLPPPRLFLLSSLVDFQCDAVVDSVAVAVHRDDEGRETEPSGPGESLPATAAALVAGIVDDWVHFSWPSKPSELTWKLALSKIVEAGFSKVSGERVLGMVVQEFRTNAAALDVTTPMAHSVLDTFTAGVGHKLTGLLRPDNTQRPLLSLVAKGVSASYTKLTYDARFSLAVEKCHAEDEASCLVFQAAVKEVAGPRASSAKNGKPRGRSPPRPTVRYGGDSHHSHSHPQQEAAAATSRNGEGKALVLTFTKQDHEYGWGQGGCAMAALRRAELGLTDHVPARQDHHTTVRLNDLYVLFKLDRLAAQLDTLTDTVQGLFLAHQKMTGPSLSCSGSSLGSGTHNAAAALPAASVPVEAIMDVRWTSGTMVFVHEGKASFKVVSDHVGSEVIRRSSSSGSSSGDGPPVPLVLTSMSCTCENMLLEDLTPGGEDYPVVVSRQATLAGPRCPQPPLPAQPLLTIRYQRGQPLYVETRRMQVCFTYRFLKLYLGLQNVWILPLVHKGLNFPNGEPAPAVPVSPASTPGADTRKWSLTAYDVTITLPRNSGETDLAALKARHLEVDSGTSTTTWRLPESADEASATAPPPVAFETTRTTSAAAVDELFHSLSATVAMATATATSADNDDDEEFFDAQEMDKSAAAAPPRSRASVASAAASSPSCGFGVATPVLSKAAGACHRFGIAARDVRLFAAVVDKNTRAEDMSPSRVWGLVEDGQPVYVSAKATDAGRPAGTGQDFHWKELSRDTTAFDVYWDTLEDGRARYLLAFVPPVDAARPAAAFDCHVTMAQLYLLYSVWYDNLAETPRFHARDDPFARESAEPPASVLFPDIWPAYDSRHFFQRLADLKAVWDFGIIAPTLTLGLRLDRDTFLVQPPSFFMADNNLGTPVLEVAQIELGNVCFVVSGGEGAVKLSFGAGHMQAVDLREPSRTLQPPFLRCGDPAAMPAGYVDPHFGFTTDIKVVAPALPLQVTLSSTPDNWMCINVGVLDAEAVHKDLSVVWLVVDIFSYYFRFLVYGKPDLALLSPVADDQSPRVLSGGSQSLLLNGGTDVRVWTTRPCVSAPEDPLAKDAATLVVYCGGHLYYRYKGDLTGSTLMHVRAEAMSLGLGTGLDATAAVRRLLSVGHWGPSVAESRILLDGLSLDLLYCYDLDSNHLEVQVSLPAIEKERHAAAMHGSLSPLVDKKLGDDPFVQPPPFAVHPLEMPSRSLALPGAPKSPSSSSSPGPRLCYVMGSHLDLAFVLGTVVIFIGPTPDALVDLNHELVGFRGAPVRLPLRSREGRKALRSALASHLQRETQGGDYGATGLTTQSSLDRGLSKTWVSASGGQDGVGSSERAMGAEEEDESSLTCQVTVEVAAVKLLLIDPTLGLHLPLIKVVVGELQAMVYQGPSVEVGGGGSAAGSLVPEGFKLKIGSGGGEENARPLDMPPTSPPLSPSSSSPRRRILAPSLNVSLHTRLWSDYFNIALKCWEPLLEPFACRVLYEDGHVRGKGLTVRSYCPLLVNVSSAFLQTLGYTSRLVQRIEPDLLRFDQLYLLLFTTVHDRQLVGTVFDFGQRAGLEEGLRTQTPAFHNPMAEMEEVSLDMPMSFFAGSAESSPHSLRISHEVSKPLLPENRAPFSICNLTGQVLRCFQPHGGGKDAALVSLQYLRHGDIARLSFGATMTVLQNLVSLEVPFDVDRDLFMPGDDQAPPPTKPHRSPLLVPQGSQLHEQLPFYPRLLGKGWSISVQLGGYRWLTCVSADALGVRYESLRPLPGTPGAERLLDDWKLNNALKLVSEVRLLDGCRQLMLRSVFRVRNCTKHDVVLVAHPSSDYKPSLKDLLEEETGLAAGDKRAKPGRSTTLLPNATYNVPLLLLRQAAFSPTATASALGKLWVKPKKWPAAAPRGPLSRHPHRSDDVQFSTEPVDLKTLVDESAKLFEASLHHHGGGGGGNEVGSPSSAAAALQRVTGRHLICPIRSGNQPSTVVASSALGGGGVGLGPNGGGSAPPVSYCVEVVRTDLKKLGGGGGGGHGHESTEVSRKRTGTRAGGSKKREAPHDPVEYMILIHPPLVLENLLPEACVFELHDFKSKNLLWKAHLQAGQSLPVHDVRLDSPLVLVVQTEYCRSPEGALIHKGNVAAAGGAADHDVDTSISMLDTENQKLVLELHHQVGGAGQRRTTVYTPYWLVNNTNCVLTYLQEGKSVPPAGTLSAGTVGAPTMGVGHDKPPTAAPAGPGDVRFRRQDGATDPGLSPSLSPSPPGGAPLLDHGVRPHHASFSSLNISGWNKKRHKQFPGEDGLQHFHRKVKGGLRTNTTKMSTHFTDSYDLEELCEASFMFNFAEDAMLTLAQRRLKVKVNDSGWSKGFSLDTVGVNQVLTVRHPQWGDMEIGFVINLAPGRLGQFTKVVFFCPRYVVWNRHPLPMYLSQDSTYFRLGHISDEIASHSVAQAHLPRSSEKRVSVQLKGAYDKSTPFIIDDGMDLCLKLSRQTDLSRIKHLMTRKAPEFDIFLPPSQEIGVWLETDWNHENLVVKALKAGRWAEKTEIQKGDMLLTVEGQRIAGKNFRKVMAALKELLATTGATLRFRTREEHMRLLRLRALGQLVADGQSLQRQNSGPDGQPVPEGPEYISVQLKPVGPSVYVIVGKLDPTTNPPYRIVNRTKHYMLHFRQLGCESHPWVSLAPHESAMYAWEEPMKSHKLDLRVALKKGGGATPGPGPGQDHHGRRRRSIVVHPHRVANEFASKNTTVRVRLDEIGFVHTIALPEPYSDDGRHLVARVEAEGTTRVLYVSKDGSGEESVSVDTRQAELAKLRQTYLQHRNVYQQLTEEMALRERQERLADPQRMLKVLNLGAVESAIGGLQDELDSTDHIRERHHLLVEVKEAKGLRAADVTGLSDPFVQVGLKIHDRVLKRDPSYKQSFTTYVVEKTLNPKWQNQLFIFKVPPQAPGNAKAYSLHVKVKDFDGPVKKSDFLGRVDMQLDVLESEAELDGWYFLTPRPQLFQQSTQVGTDQPDLGAIHLRMRWVHSLKGLVSHLEDWTEAKLQDVEVQERQLLKEKLEQEEVGAGTPHQHLQLDGGGGGPIKHKKLANVVRIMDARAQARDSPGSSGVGRLTNSVRGMFGRDSEDNGDNVVVLPDDAQSEAPPPPMWERVGSRAGAVNPPAQLASDFAPLSPPDTMRARVALSRWRKRQHADRDLGSGGSSGQHPPLQHDGSYGSGSGGSSSSHRHSTSHVGFAAELFMNGVGVPSFMRPRSYTTNQPAFHPSRAQALHPSGKPRYPTNHSTRRLLATQHGLARRSFEQEVARSHRCVNNPGGTLRIRPLQALNLGEKAKPVYVTVRYGLHLQRTGKAKPGVYPRWENANGRNELALQVEHLNTTGGVHITVWSEHELQDVELGHIEVPLGSVIDCCDDHGDYVRWFPLLRPAETQSVEGDTARSLYPWTSEKASSEDFANETCLKLGFRWIPFDKTHLPVRTNAYLRAFLTEVAVAVIDSYQRTELLSLTVRSIEARYVDNPALTRASLVVSSVQLDNQLPKTEAPIVFGPTPMQMPQPLLHCSLFRQKDKSELTRPDNLIRLKYVFILLQEVDVKIEEDFIHALWQSLSRVLIDHLVTASTLQDHEQQRQQQLQQQQQQQQLQQQSLTGSGAGAISPPPGRHKSGARGPSRSGGSGYNFVLDGTGAATLASHPLEDRFAGVHSPSRGMRNGARNTPGAAGHDDDEDSDQEDDAYPYLTQMVYIEQLELCPVKVNISFFKNSADRKLWKAATASLASTNALAAVTGIDASHLIVNNQLTSAAARRNPRVASIFTTFQVLTDVVLPLVPTISDASIKLNALDIAHVFQSPTEICATLQAHYTSNFLFQLYKIIGSVDIIGNPLSFASSLGTGMIDFFYEPAQGLVKSPKAFVRGVVKGTSSLVTNTTSGFVGVVGKISKSVGNGVLFTLSKDQRFMQSRERLAKERNEVYVRPVKDFFHGLFHGVTGIVADPYYGARRDGCRGFAVGLGYGLVGVVAKPVVGVLDAIAHTSDGFRDLAMVISMEKRLDPVRRHRLQHTFANDGRLLPYDVQLARGLLVLQQFGRTTSKKKLGSTDAGHDGAGGGTTSLGPDGASSTKTDMGGAMAAAVEAAGRTVLSSTKHVVSAVAGTLNIVEAREETLETWGIETDDTVILTETFKRDANEETLLVLSTKRVVCVDCTYKSGSTPEVHLVWQAPLKAIRNVDLKNMPLVLTFAIDRQAAKTMGHTPVTAAGGESGHTMQAGGEEGDHYHHHGQHHRPQMVQKRLFGDWQHDNVAFMRAFNLLKCLLGRVDEVNTDMGYGFGVPCQGGGFQFGVWEFAAAEPAVPPRLLLGATRSEDAATGAADAWPLFRALEQARWVDGGGEREGIVAMPTSSKKWTAISVLPPIPTSLSSIGSSGSSSSSIASTTRNGGMFFQTRVEQSLRPPPVPATTPLSLSSSSPPPVPKSGAAATTGPARPSASPVPPKVLVEEETLRHLLTKVDLLEARLRDMETSKK